MDGGGVNVKSVEALKDLQRATDAFQGESQTAMRVAIQAIEEMHQIMQQHVRAWEQEVQLCEEAKRQAEGALNRCLASGTRDPKTGAYYSPPCTAEHAAVAGAASRLADAVRELARIREWGQIVTRETSDYRDQHIRLDHTLQTTLPSGRAFLAAKIAELEKFLT